MSYRRTAASTYYNPHARPPETVVGSRPVSRNNRDQGHFSQGWDEGADYVIREVASGTPITEIAKAIDAIQSTRGSSASPKLKGKNKNAP